MQCPASAPDWLQWAWGELGTKEDPGNSGPAIRRYIDLASCGEEGDPWCAIFANAALESTNYPGTRSPSSQSFRHDTDFMPLEGPALGAIVVYWRVSPQSGLGHVGFYCGQRENFIWTLGGNEGDMVQIEMMAKSASNFGLIGYWWPRTAAPPGIAPIIVSADVPRTQVTVT
jgi:uncharacterized protein (TIGR02594 family)